MTLSVRVALAVIALTCVFHLSLLFIVTPRLLVQPLLHVQALVPPLVRLQALVPMVQRQPHRVWLFSGMPSEMSSSPAVVVTKKLRS